MSTTNQPRPPVDLLDSSAADPEANYVNMDVMLQQQQPNSTATPHHNNNNPHSTNSDDDSLPDELKDDNLSIVSSVLTADGIHDTTGFLCVCLVILIGDMSRGVLFPSMWPMVEHLGGSTVLLGYAVAAFSFGRVLVNPLFGSWSHTLGYTKTLLMSTAILFFGTLLYAQVYRVGRPEFLIVAQTVLGIGSGTLGVTRAFVAEVTARRNRTTYMAWITAVQYAGFTVTPLIGAGFNWLLQNDSEQENFINMFTAPAYFMTVVCAAVWLVLWFCFKDRQRIATHKDAKKADNPKLSQRRQEIDRVATTTVPWVCNLTIYDCCILGCLLLNVSTKGSIASFETMGIAVAESHFHMLPSRAGFIVGICGTLGVMALLSMGSLAARYSDIQLIGGGMVVMALGVSILTSLQEDEDDVVLVNPTWKYILAMFLIYSIGYPIGHTAVIGLFSKIVGRRPQGTLLGWFASAGSLARMFFPILSGYIINYQSVETLFAVLVVVLIISTGFVSYCRQTLLLLSS